MKKRKLEKLFSAALVGLLLFHPTTFLAITADSGTDLAKEGQQESQRATLDTNVLPSSLEEYGVRAVEATSGSLNEGEMKQSAENHSKGEEGLAAGVSEQVDGSQKTESDTKNSENVGISGDPASQDIQEVQEVQENQDSQVDNGVQEGQENPEVKENPASETGQDTGQSSETPVSSAATEESASTEDSSETEESDKKEKTVEKTPRATVVQVSTGEELKNAYNNQAVTAVSFTRDIVISGNILTERSTSFSIEGNGYKLDLGGSLFKVKLASTAVMDIRNISEIKSSSVSTLQGVVHYSDVLATAVSGWEINFTNVRSHEDNVIRIASVPGAQLNLAGEIYWKTRSEMALIDGVYIAPNAKVTAIKQPIHDDRSFFWYSKSNMTQATSGSRKFEVGENATANFKMTGSGYLYPVVFAYYTELRLKKGASFNATMPGNAWRSDYYNSSFIAEGNNRINLTSLTSGSAPVAFGSAVSPAVDSYFSVGPQSELYVIGATNRPLFNTTSAIDAARMNVIIDNPKSYDLRNYSSGTTVNSSIANANIKTFQIKNSDIGTWRLATNADGPADYLAEAATITQTNGTVTSTTDSTLSSYFPTAGIRRISGLNQDPELKFNSVTDADKSVKARVILGYSPDNNGMADDGSVNYIPVYAGKDQAKADITDSLGTKFTDLTTDANGYVKTTGTQFQMKNKTVTGSAKRGGRSSVEQATSTVIDVTPPNPTGLAGGSSIIAPTTKTLSGSTEAGAKITLYKNGSLTSVTATADASGRFNLTLPSIVSGDKLQVIATDNAGLANVEDRPTTNSASGNKNPLTALSYREAVFNAGPIVTVGLAATITADDVTINKGASFNPLSANNNLSARDIDGSNITSKITVKSNSVNVNVPGTYEVVYQVTGNNSVTITKAITVTVKGGGVVIGDAVIKIENKNRRIRQFLNNFNPLDGVKATDGDGTEITHKIAITYNDVDTQLPGNYVVYFAVTGANGNRVTDYILVEVYKMEGPEIIAEDITLYIGQSFDPITHAQFINIDGTPMPVEYLTEDYNVDTSKVGEYEVIYFAISEIDYSYSSKTIIVRVIEWPAKIDAPEVLELYVGTTFDPKNHATASDSDGTDLTNQLIVASNTVNTETEGEGQVVYKVTGRNEEEVTFTMRVIVLKRPQETSFISYPERISFGQIEASNQEQNVFGQLSEALIVKDQRENQANHLKIKVQEITPLTSSETAETLAGYTYFQKDGQKTFITQDQVIVATKDDAAEEFNVSQFWQADGEGIYLSLPVENQRVGSYHGKYSWSIEDTP
ncbi:hypothetical protein BAU15_00315 [Enterococcus sp. JM4C]|uniref:immunoglobulin-like domain-containing protein n=1 Tax=Candidatus Enterococcus huntleyi TaxID=1857217 RepID=UPI00137B791E|nr:immunoglobulin-like domain-containing protein [Enterococcus sp. JM4C]KAF1299123.1 hypothetical protein BAU15_00315 [Enterococcus sp. JM4C]